MGPSFPLERRSFSGGAGKEALFRAIRKRPPHHENHLKPYMIIDNPERLREMIEETHSYFTHPGAEEVVTTMKGEMDASAARVEVIADKI